MNIAWETIAGVIAGFGLFIFAIYLNTDNYMLFFSLSSFVMVVGGTLAASFISFSGRYVIKALIELLKITVPSSVNPKTLFRHVGMIIEWSNILRREGIPALDKLVHVDKVKDPFVKYGVSLLLSDYHGEDLKKMLENFLKTTYERSMVQANILKTMSMIAPAFGMIGTLVGLVIMLDKMAGDPSALGAGLAVALLTTLYGVLFAQLILKPASLKLAQKESMLRFRNNLLVEGFVLLSERKSPFYIQDSLNSFLDPKMHFEIAQ